MLDATPYATFQLSKSANEPLSEAVAIRLDTYEFSVNTNSKIVGDFIGIPQFDALKIVANQQENSPAAFALLARGDLFARAVLTQFDATGNAVSAWVLANLMLAEETIQNDGSVTLEQLSFTFSQITEASSQATASWNIPARQPQGPSVPAEIRLSPYKSIASSAELQLFTREGDFTPAVTLKLERFEFGAHRDLEEQRDTLAFDKVVVTAPLSSASPLLLRAVTTNLVYGQAKILQRGASGTLEALWSMDKVIAVGEHLQASDESLPVANLTFDFTTISNASRTSVFQWNRINSAEIPGGTPLPQGSDGNVRSNVPSSNLITTGITLDLRGGTATPISLYINTYAFGFHSDATIRNGTPFRTTSFDKMDVGLDLPDDAPRLLGVLVTGKHYATATLTQRNATGAVNNVWVLGTVVLSDLQSQGMGDGSTEQNLSFRFASISHATSTDTVAWNVFTQQAEGPVLPGSTIVSLPDTSSTLSLNLYTTGRDPVLRIPVNNFNFGMSGTFLTSTGSTTGTTSFDPLEVTTLYQNFSPQILLALTRGTVYARATLTQQGQIEPITLVNFGSIYVTDNYIEGTDGDLPFQTIHFEYIQITQSAGNIVRSWDIAASRPNGPAPLPGLDLAAVPVPTGKIRLLLDGRPSLAPVDLWVDSANLGYTKTTTGLGFGAIEITAQLSAMSPRIFAALTSALSFPTGRITQYDGEGNIIADWQLKNVFLAADKVEGDQSSTVQTLQLSYQAFLGKVKGIQTEWDIVRNSGDSLSSPGRSHNSLREIHNGLVLELGGGPAPGLTIPLSNFVLGYEHQIVNNISSFLYKPLIVSAESTEDTARLFSYMLSGDFYRTARLLKYENSVFPTAGWHLSNVYLREDQFQAADEQATKQLEFVYDNLAFLAPTDLQLSASAPSITYGQTTTLSARVTSNTQAVTRGSVRFMLGDQILATVPVNSSGRATVVLDSLNVTGSPYTVEAVYLPVEPYFSSVGAVSVNVAPATLLITPDDLQAKLYGAAMPALTFKASGFIPGDDPQILVGSLGTTAQASSAVGTYPYLVTGLSAGANYTIQLNGSSTFTIQPAPLTIIADDKTRAYGLANPTLTATISGLVNNDNDSVVTGLTLSTTATLDSLPSNTPYPITASGATAANYTIAYVAGGLTITTIQASSSGVTFTPTAGAPFNGVVATFTLPGPALPANSFMAQIAWGNGRTSSGVVTQNGNSYTVTGRHTFGINGQFNLSISIRQSSGLTAPMTVSSLAFVNRLGFGQTQSVAFWSSSEGQSLIRSFNGNPTNTELANWLAATYPNMYGAQSGNQNLTGRSNAYVAGRFISLSQRPHPLDQAAMATALNVYASTLSLGGSAGGRAGFQVTVSGLGGNLYNVGPRGAAFSVPNDTQLTVAQMLSHINSQTTNGSLYRATPLLRTTAQQMLEQVNVPGRSGVLNDQVQTVDFWVSDRGVSLMRGFGGTNSRTLSSWLSANYRNLYGASAGTNNLVGKTNAQVAAYLQTLSSDPTAQAAAQVLTLALNLYASTRSLGGTIPRNFGFNVTEFGLGAAYFNIGQSGAVGGVANQSTINVYALLQAINRQAVEGRLFNGNSSLSNLCLELSRRLNSAS